VHVLGRKFKKLGCAYGFGVGDFVDMRCDRLESDGDAGSPFFFFFIAMSTTCCRASPNDELDDES